MTNISKYIYQKDNLLYTKEDCIIRIKKEDYPLPSFMVFNDQNQSIWLKSLISEIIYQDISFDMILDYPVIFHYQKMTQTNDQIELFFESGSLLFEIPMETDSIKESVAYLERLAGGKETFKNVSHLFLKIYRIFKDADMDIVHPEIFLSNILRDSNNDSIPARLSQKWNPKLINMKDIVYKTGFITGLSFENIGKAINTGLTTDVYNDPSILERVMLGKVVEKPKE